MFSFLLILSCIIFNVQANPAKAFLDCPAGTNECVKNVVQEFYKIMLTRNPAIGAEEMDPMSTELIIGDFSTIKYSLTNVTTKGFRSCEVKEATSKPEESLAQYTLLCEFFEWRGLYDIDGSILLRNVKGKGNYVISSGKYEIIHNLQLRKITKNGKHFLKMEDFSFKAVPLEPVTFNVNKVFGGNKELDDDFLMIANKNWKQITLELLDPFFDVTIKKIIQNGNKYLNTYPIN